MNPMWKRIADWHEGRAAARMLVAALGGYMLSTLIRLPAPYTAVITTLIVARPHTEGVLQASLERVFATLVGAAIACAVSFGRLAHAPEPLLLAIALIPITLVVAHNSAYRSAMIAAIIVLSAPAVQGSPLYVAGMRMLGVGIGAAIGTLVSVAIVPSRREVLVLRAAASLLEQFIPLLRNAIDAGSLDDGARYKLEYRIRQSLRELALLIKHRPDGPPARVPAAAVVQSITHLQADIVFLKREVRAQFPPSSPGAALTGMLEALEPAFGGVAALARQQAPAPDLGELRKAWENAERLLRGELPQAEGVRLMVTRIVDDLTALVRAIQKSTAQGR